MEFNTNDNDLYWMDSLSGKCTGILNVILWVGATPEHDGKRIKVGNIPANRPTDTSFETFDITLPDFQIKGEVNKSFITSEILEQIKKWISINIAAINEYYDSNILTDHFIFQLQKV